MNKLKIGFIGGGKMAQAITKGFLKSSIVKPSQISVNDVSAACLQQFKDMDTNVTVSNVDVVKDSEVIFLAVKPNNTEDVLREVRHVISPDNLIVSLAAGVNINSLQKHLPDKSKVVRVMPNMPALIQSGVSVYSRGEFANEDDAVLVQRLLACTGMAQEMPETMMDAVTGLSGSGPAYVFLMIQALADGGVSMGLPRDQAIRLAAQVLMGSAQVILETGLHPEQLKDAVCSPGGTSIHGVQQLEEGGLRATLIRAVQAATKRSIELGKS